MASRKSLSVFVTVVLLTLVGIAWFVFSTQFQRSSSPSAISLPTNTSLIDKDGASLDEETELSETQKPDDHKSFVIALARCFPELSNSVPTPVEFIQNWKSTHPKATKVIDYVHYFFRDSNMNEFRAQILYTYTNGRPVREFKMFRVLDDGLPDPVAIPANDSHNPSDTILGKYIDFETIFETQKKWSSVVSKTESIEVEETNTQINEFQLFQSDLRFRCHEGECECLRK